MAPQVIPGLLNDLAMECLLRIPHSFLSSLKAVSPLWKILIESDRFHVQTRSRRSSDPGPSVFLLTQISSAQFEFLEVCLQDLECIFSFTRSREELPPPLCLQGGAQAHVKDCVLFVGGRQNDMDVHIFDLARRTWRRGARMLRPCSDFAWGLIQNKIFVVGGDYSDSAGSDWTPAEAYDLAMDCWSSVASIPVALSIYAYFVSEGKLFVQGRSRNSDDSKAYSYDPLKDEWKEDRPFLGLQDAGGPCQFVPILSQAIISVQTPCRTTSLTVVEARLTEKGSRESYPLAKYTLNGESNVFLRDIGSAALLLLPCKKTEKLRLKSNLFCPYFQQLFVPCSDIIGATVIKS